MVKYPQIQKLNIHIFIQPNNYQFMIYIQFV